MKLLIAILFLALLPNLQANVQAETLSTYRIHSPDPIILHSLGRLFEIETRINQNDYEVIVPANQSQLLLSIMPSATLVHADNAQAIRAKLESFRSSLLSSEFRYHNLAEVQQWMTELAAKFPKNAKVVQYGTSQQNRPLLALQISGDISGPEGDSLMITSATHGDELITVEVMMNLIDRLMSGYGSNPRFTNMVNNHNIYFIPVLNPDGYARQDRYDNGKDPNRSYPFPDRPNNIPTKSISAIMQFFASKNIIGSIDFHAYGEMIMYPWAYTHDPVDPASAAHFHEVTRYMADSNRYAYGPISDVIYVAPGSSADYYFWKKKSVSLGIEMGQDKVPDPSEFPSYFESQAESTWRFIESFSR